MHLLKEPKKQAKKRFGTTLLLLAAAAMMFPTAALADDYDDDNGWRRKPKNVIFFLGDGMGMSTVTATRIYSVGVDGELIIDKFPNVGLSRVATADHITPDSAGTMSAMMTGVNHNSGVIGFPPTTERGDFNNDGDDAPLWTIAELAKRRGMKVGVVSTTRLTHATPAAVYAHVNERNLENDIALQSLPGDATYNERLRSGLDILMGGGRRHFVPNTMADEEGGTGKRTDDRDLRVEYQDAGYEYVYDKAGFDSLDANDLPVLGLFEGSHMEYEYDRPTDAAGEPSLAEMTGKAVDLLEQATRKGGKGYFLMVEGGRIDHAHHEVNAWRTLTDTEEFDEAVAAAIERVKLRDTMIIVTADHGHVFTIAGYPMRNIADLQYAPTSSPAEYLASPFANILDIVYDINGAGEINPALDSSQVPYTTLVYGNGGANRNPRFDPRTDVTPGYAGEIPVQVGMSNSNHPAYRQEAAVPMSSETHSGEDTVFYGIGAGSESINGTMRNWEIFEIMRTALGL